MYLKELKDRCLNVPTILLVLYSIAVSMTLPLITLVLFQFTIPNFSTLNPYAPIPDNFNLLLLIFTILKPVISKIGYPIIGYLVDTILGRSTAISISLFSSWLGTLLYVFCYSIKYSFLTTYSIYILSNCLFAIALVLFVVGSVTFFATVLSYAMDQMVYETSAKLRAFIHWLSWGYFVGFLVSFLYIPQSIDLTSQIKVLSTCIVVFGIQTVSIVLHISMKDTFIPSGRVKDTGYKMVFKVLKYAWKNKYPQNRSAYGFWEQSQPSRFDLAKTRYGGPYTEDAVENTKTSYSMVLIFLASFGIYIPHALIQNILPLSMQYQGAKSDLDGYGLSITYTSFNQIILFVIPIFELIIIPLYPKIEFFLTHSCRLIISSNVFMIASLMTMILLDIIGSYAVNGAIEHCIVSFCFNTFKVPYQLYIIVFVLTGFSTAFNIIGVFGFICSQVSSSYVGLLTALFWFINGGYIFLGTVIPVPFIYTKTGVSKLHDNFWVLLVQLVISLAGLIVLSIACYKYKTAKALSQRQSEHKQTQVVIENNFDKVLRSASGLCEDDILEIISSNPSGSSLPTLLVTSLPSTGAVPTEAAATAAIPIGKSQKSIQKESG